MSETTAPAIEAVDLVKRFGDFTAVDGVSFSVPTGTVFSMLGPNGAGKTTTVRMMTTLSAPTSGSARVAGFDVASQPDAVRHRMGLTAQAATVDELLTGRENLRLIGDLYGLDRALVRRSTDELLERFSLTEAGSKVVKDYSGGMRRRLDLAASLVAQPEVLFLDEPTTGLDPRSRLGLWDIIRALVHEGTTLLLTTQYLEEADRLANSIAVIDAGRVIAEGTASDLKSRVGGDVLELRTMQPTDLQGAVGALATAGFDGEPALDGERGTLRLPVTGGDVLAKVVRALDGAGIEVDELALHRPTLDDVFLALTGHAADDQAVAKPQRGRGRGRGAAEAPVEVSSR
jgi:ABC-2 type transport system ATP-binding protein